LMLGLESGVVEVEAVDGREAERQPREPWVEMQVRRAQRLRRRLRLVVRRPVDARRCAVSLLDYVAQLVLEQVGAGRRVEGRPGRREGQLVALRIGARIDGARRGVRIWARANADAAEILAERRLHAAARA